MPSPNPESLVSTALSKVRYRHPDLCRRDMLAVFQFYRGLTPRPDKFIFNDGLQRDLITLSGTIPVPYKGQSYNIPVAVWLLDTHPYNAPLCYVKPTQDMQIKVSKHVDLSGKIYLPYLHDWSYPNSDLVGLIQVCIITFSEQPPVYSRPKDAAHLPYPTAGPYGGFPALHPPQPGVGAAATQSPPYPTAAGYPPYPPVGGGGTAFSPPYPPASNNMAAAGYTGYGPYPPPPAASYQNQSNPGPANMANSGTITQEHIKASILSAVEDKVRRRINEEFSARQAESDSLKKIGEDLATGRGRLTQMLAKLNKESADLQNNIRILSEKQKEMSEMTAKLEATNEIDVDDAVTVTAPLYRQLITAYADESATDDALYFLGEALRRGVVDCDTFLKHVRNLSRKQFMLRATMQKCREKAGLTV